MSFASDDLAPILAAAGQESNAGLTFGQGIVVAFNPLTAENQINYRGALLRNLPILNTTEAVLLKPGSIVALLGWRTSYFILGRVTIPNTPEAATALDMVRIYSDSTPGIHNVSSPAFADADGPVIEDVLISNSGRALVMLTASIIVSPSGAGAEHAIGMGFRVSGATTLAANSERIRWTRLDGDGITNDETSTTVVSLDGADAAHPLLNPGFHTFTAQYMSVIFGANTPSVYARNLTVIPF